ncbi:MAG: DUF3857 domain-containing protein [Sphingomicrobium sp.]
MRWSRVFLVASLASASVYAQTTNQVGSEAAINSNRPLLGPPESWVLPAKVPPAPAAADGAATVDLLVDTQRKLTNNGDTIYYSRIFKIASPQGLEDGPLKVNWDPSLETLTLHRYRILRGEQTLDLLGDGSKLSVIQRERNLERAMLDGELTVTLQPEDLRVGDAIEIAFSRTHLDPAMQGRSEALFGPRDGNPYGRYRARVIWPSSKDIKWRAYPGALQPKLTRNAQGSELTADLFNLLPPRAPRGAPSRFGLVNAIQVSEFADWGSVAQAFLPLFETASKLPADSKVRTEAARIAALTPDPKRRAELALTLVQNEVRYLFLAMGDGGYVPTSAEQTWSRRFGDCKARTVLLIALLREMGIEARPALVNTDDGDLVGAKLPAMGSFDHVIVELRVAGRTYWVDGTRQGDTKLDLLAVPSYYFALPVAPNVKGLVKLVPEQLHKPTETISLALDASAGIDAPAPAKAEARFRGESAVIMRARYAGLASFDRDERLRKFWRDRYDFVSPTAVSTAFDDDSGEFVLALTGTAKMDWYRDGNARWYELDRARVGWKWDISREGDLNKDAPYEIDFPDYWESRQTIKLPQSGTGFRLQGGAVNKDVGGVYAFHRKVDINGDTLSMEASTRALAAELPASKAEQSRSEIAALAGTGVYVRVPDEYVATDADLVALKDDKSATARALLHRGAVQFDKGSFDASLADLDAALLNDPSLSAAHAIRAMILASKGDERAIAAANRALELNDKQDFAWRAKGSLALNQDRWDDAETAFTKELALDPKDDRALIGRGTARLMLSKNAEALSDFDAALLISPQAGVKDLRATALYGLGRLEDALAAFSANPSDPGMRLMRADILSSLGRRTEAISELDGLIRTTPKAEYYVARAALWQSADQAKRDRDIAAALRLDPKSVRALSMRSFDAIEKANYKAAESDIAAIEKFEPDSRMPSLLRIELFQKQGRPQDALRIADADVAKSPKDPTILNARCWMKATLNIDLAAAIKDCDTALSIDPNRADILDSRAFAKLRLGSADAAIVDYNSALKLSPGLAASLFGRALARARIGDIAAARSDLAEARKANSDVDKEFAKYGIEIPASLRVE